MSLLLISTDGTETGATAAKKINNAITATDNNTQQISTNKLDIISLNDRTSTVNDTINDLAVRTSATEKNLSNINTRLSGYYNKTETYSKVEVDTKIADIPTTDLSGYYKKPETYSKFETNSLVTTKQDNLVSGTNIKTINGQSVLGSGDIVISSGGGGAVDSVAGKTGVVTLVKGDVGLNNVDNTSDTNKPISTATQTALNSKVDKVITGLGTGEHLEYWNYEPSKIIELDWEENFDLGDGFKIHCETSRHFSGRSLKRDQSIWASFALITPTQKIYIGGDSGYDSHFKKIGEKFGGFDLAILETGQYNQDWKYIHMIPAEQLQAMQDLKAKKMLPVHHSKFVLATHPWDEPLNKITEMNTENLKILTPKIGEKTTWEDDLKIYERWWKAYD